MGKKLTGIRYGILLLALTSTLWSEEEPKSLGLDYSITTGESGELVWEIKGPAGGNRDLSTEEKQRLLREEFFPEALEKAEAGEEPEVWTVGFFYVDGMATEKNLEKAEAAFRHGLDFDRPDGLLYLADGYYRQGIEEEDLEKRKDQFRRSEIITTEVLGAGFESASSLAISLASVHMFGWYDTQKDLGKADEILTAVESVLPENPSVQLHKAKLFIYQKRYSEAFEYAERAEKGFLELPGDLEVVADELKRAKASKISAAVLGGQISKVDPEEFLELSKDSLGLNGPMAWSIPVILLLVLGFLLWRSRLSWSKGEEPGLQLSICWISVAILAAGIGFNIRLPGLDNGVGHWIGAILVTLFGLLAMTIGGWGRYFGLGPLFTGPKNLFKGLGIIVAGIAGLQIIAMGYGALVEFITGSGLDQQLVSLFLKSENLPQLVGTLMIVGIAIPFYEEVFFRGFLFDALDRRWGTRAALVVSSAAFALVHGLTFAVPLLFLSFALGWLRVRTGNLRMSFYLHAANNSFSVLLGYFLSPGV